MNLFTGCTYHNMLVHQSPKADDMKIFSNRQGKLRQRLIIVRFAHNLPDGYKALISCK
jgi:hypothetical protein